MTSHSDCEKQRWISWGLVAVACITYIYLRFDAGLDYGHPDEMIPVKIIENIFQSGVWDTNFISADLPEYFKYNQYSFSSYIIVSAIIAKVVTPVLELLGIDAELLSVLRYISAFFQVGVIWMTFVLGRALFGSSRVGIVASWVVVVFPLLFQDSLYARPESFVALLSLVVVFITAKLYESPKSVGVFVLGGLIGLLIACKITFLVLLALPGIVICRQWREKFGVRIKWGGLGVGGLIVGFIGGVPHVLMNGPEYVSGVMSAVSHYGSTHRPHGLADGNFWERALYGWQYFEAIGAGLFLLMAVVGWGFCFKKNQYFHFFVMGLCFLLIVYFSTKPVFFERNYSFTIPILASCVSFGIFEVVALFGKYRKMKAIASCALIVATLFPLGSFIWKFEAQVLSGEHRKARKELRAGLESHYETKIKNFVWLMTGSHYEQFREEISRNDKGSIYEIFGANDTYTDHYLAQAIEDLGMTLITELPSPFEKNELPASTLYTYHAGHYFYLRDKSSVITE
jgi:hypothetical protein